MKRQLKLFIAITIVCGAFAVSGNAQTSVSQIMRARIPFTFTVGEKTLPAGVYTVSILNPSSDRKVLQIRSENGRVSAIIQTVGAEGAVVDNAKLEFRRYGESYFFAKAQMAGESTGLAATKTRAERATQRALRHGRHPSVIAIVAE